MISISIVSFQIYEKSPFLRFIAKPKYYSLKILNFDSYIYRDNNVKPRFG